MGKPTHVQVLSLLRSQEVKTTKNTTETKHTIFFIALFYLLQFIIQKKNFQLYIKGVKFNTIKRFNLTKKPEAVNRRLLYASGSLNQLWKPKCNTIFYIYQYFTLNFILFFLLSLISITYLLLNYNRLQDV